MRYDKAWIADFDKPGSWLEERQVKKEICARRLSRSWVWTQHARCFPQAQRALVMVAWAA